MSARHRNEGLRPQRHAAVGLDPAPTASLPGPVARGWGAPAPQETTRYRVDTYIGGHRASEPHHVDSYETDSSGTVDGCEQYVDPSDAPASDDHTWGYGCADTGYDDGSYDDRYDHDTWDEHRSVHHGEWTWEDTALTRAGSRRAVYDRYTDSTLSTYGGSPPPTRSGRRADRSGASRAQRQSATRRGGPRRRSRRHRGRSATMTIGVLSLAVVASLVFLRLPGPGRVDSPVLHMGAAGSPGAPPAVHSIAAGEPTTAGDRSPAPPDPSGRLTAGALRDEFAQVVAGMPGDYSIAWMPVGGGAPVQNLGAIPDEDAWSTIKVPLAMAYVDAQRGPLTASERRRLHLAITLSDNTSAVTMFRRLGSAEAARSAVEGVLRSAGDTSTEIDMPLYGLSRWTLPDQARFAAGMSCRPGTATVLDLMGDIAADQRWGLGSTGLPAVFKGGWGDSGHGYLMRQLGIVTLPSGSRVAVALAGQSRIGHPAGAKALSDLARWFTGKLTDADGGACTKPA